MNENDVKAIVSSEIKKFVNDTLDKEIKKILRNANSQSRDELVTIIKNGFDGVFKTLWSKKDFWRESIR